MFFFDVEEAQVSVLRFFVQLGCELYVAHASKLIKSFLLRAKHAT